METAGQTCLRLLDALEALAAKEHSEVRAGRIPAALRTQQRAHSVIGRMAELLERPDLAARAAQTLLPRIKAIQADRSNTLDLLGASLQANRDQIQKINAADRRLNGMKAAYGSSRETRSAAGASLRDSA